MDAEASGGRNKVALEGDDELGRLGSISLI
jgi:hypothetical protein